MSTSRLPSANQLKPKKKSTQTRTRLDVEARRQQLLDLGLVLFSDRAYDEVPIEEVAKLAGISKGLLYHYFPTKRDFYIAVVREAAQLLLACTIVESDSPIEGLRGSLDAYLQFVEARGPAYAALMRGGIGSDHEVNEIIEETRQAFVRRFFERAPHIPSVPTLRMAVRGWIGFVETISLDWLEQPSIPRETVLDLATQALIKIMEIFLPNNDGIPG
jgi:AcrR family transcriptional regulator